MSDKRDDKIVSNYHSLNDEDFIEPILLHPGDPTPNLPFIDDDWSRFYGPSPGSPRGTTHWENHEKCNVTKCRYREEPCKFHLENEQYISEERTINSKLS